MEFKQLAPVFLWKCFRVFILDEVKMYHSIDERLKNYYDYEYYTCFVEEFIVKIV